MSPDNIIFNAHVAGGNFQTGLAQGMWGFPALPGDLPWPYAVLWVKAADKKDAPEKYFFRFTLDGYPTTPPSACPWDNDKAQILDPALWPRGGPVTMSIFNPGWKSFALYTPLDRVAQDGHGEWMNKHPSLWWTPKFQITDYLNFLHRNLNSSDYAPGKP